MIGTSFNQQTIKDKHQCIKTTKTDTKLLAHMIANNDQKMAYDNESETVELQVRVEAFEPCHEKMRLGESPTRQATNRPAQP